MLTCDPLPSPTAVYNVVHNVDDTTLKYQPHSLKFGVKCPQLVTIASVGSR